MKNLFSIQNNIAKFFWVLLSLTGLYYFYKGTLKFTDIMTLRMWLSDFGQLAPLAYITVYTLRPFLLVPALFLNIAAGMLFGTFWGIIYILIGGLAEATLCYYLGKCTKFNCITQIADKWWAIVDRYSPPDHFKKMLCLRLVPIFPYDPISFLAGLSNIPYSTYALATFIGMLPGAIAYNLLADSFVSPEKNLMTAILALSAAFLLPYVYWQVKIKNS